ncbi:MAG: ABC transporter ATP-binding protein [Candidatus Bathyarchaeota archaeon]|nr:MAG: ABC transporter ATP-binding protein [Candidatus Bathyarchaeota archaeon]
MELAIDAKDLVKNFGNVLALDKASFTVRDREIFGLIGPNGAGKTTALRILGTLIKPTSGTADVFGNDVVRNPEKIRGIISYLPEEAGAYQNLSGYEYLSFMAGFYVGDGDTADDMMKEAKLISGLGDRLGDRVKGYSQGMKRRLLLARALMMKPKLAILDEPTSGLDVVHAFHVRQMIKDYADTMGVTVLLSSHNMLEVEYLCHRVALINEGQIIAEGKPEELKEKYTAENLEQVFMEVTRLG